MNPPMKVSLQNSKEAGSPTHNCRRFDLSKADNIDPTRTHLNHYVSFYKDLKDDFVETEKRFYAEHFKDWAEEKKRKAKIQRHPERAKTTEQLRTGRNTRPLETIYQFGDMYNAPSSTDFRKWLEQMLKYHNKITKGYAPILDAAIHNDEKSPHAHVRTVWVHKETGGEGNEYLRIGRAKALKAAGIELPYPDQPEGQHNNRLVTYTKMMREEGERLAIEMGYNIDTHHKRRKHLSKEDYIKMVESEERIQFLEHERKRLGLDQKEIKFQ